MSALLARHAASDLVAFAGEGTRTRDDLVRYVAAIHKALSDVTPGARVVLAAGDRYRFAAGLLAIWSRGAVAALPPNGQPEAVRSLARMHGMWGLVRDRDEELGLDLRAVTPLASTPDDAHVLPALDARACAVLAYTSGSSGKPVAHEKTLAQLLLEAQALCQTFELWGHRVLTAVPPHHIYGLLFSVLVPLLSGGSMSRSAPLQPSEVLHELTRHGADVLVAVPPHLSALAQYEAPFPRMHRVFSSGAPLSESTDRALLARGVTVTQVLGSTETGGIAHRTSVDAPFTPFAEVHVALGDDAALLVRSPWATADGDSALRTSDRVELVPGGFRHLGRGDAVVKVGGRRVDLGDIEARIKGLPHVRDARVLARGSSRARGVEICAVVEADAREVTVEALKRALAVHLDPVTLPRRYRIVASLPRGAAGKVAREELLALFDRWDLPREVLPPEPSEGDNHVRVRMTLPPNLGYFRGHFEGDALLPGVVQLEVIALREMRMRWPELHKVARIVRVKFKRPMRPGEELVLTLERKSEAVVHFSMLTGGEPAASGIFHFRGSAS